MNLGYGNDSRQSGPFGDFVERPAQRALPRQRLGNLIPSAQIFLLRSENNQVTQLPEVAGICAAVRSNAHPYRDRAAEGGVMGILLEERSGSGDRL